MISTTDAQTLLSQGGQVIDSDHDKIGSISQIFLDDSTGEPAWVTVKTGMFGGAESFVPLQRGTLDGDDVTVPYTKSKVKDAPRVKDSDGHLSVDEETELYRYYGLDDQSSQTSENRTQDHGTVRTSDVDADDSQRHDGSVAGTEPAAGQTDHQVANHTDDDGDLTGVVTAGNDQRGAGHDTSGPDTDSAMTRSEEQVNVGTRTETIGKARLRKYVVTENVTQTVPVSHEEVRIEREPITEANRGDAVSGGDITEEVHEVDLKGERVVVDKDVVPVERVRMDTDTVTEDQQVNEEVRQERIETETGQDTVDTTDRTTDRSTGDTR